MRNEFILINITLLYLVSICALTPVRYMAIYSYKDMTLVVNDSILLELTGDRPREDQRSHRHYAINIATDEKRKLILHFISMDISSEAHTPDRLHIYDYTNEGPIQVSPPSGLFGVYDYYFHHDNVGLHDYLSTRNKFRLDYIGKPTLVYSGFRILITSFEDVDTDGQCGKRHFRCVQKNICLPVSVRCDGLRNCGEADVSDEYQCSRELSTNIEDGTTTAILATSLSAGSFILVVISVAYIIRRHFKNRDKKLRKLDYGKRMRYRAACKDAPPCYDEVIRESPPNYDVATSNIDPNRNEIISPNDQTVMLNGTARQNSFVTSALMSCPIERDESQHDSAFQDESSSETDCCVTPPDLSDHPKEQCDLKIPQPTDLTTRDYSGETDLNEIDDEYALPGESHETVSPLKSKREDIKNRYRSCRTPSSRSDIEYIDAPDVSANIKTTSHDDNDDKLTRNMTVPDSSEGGENTDSVNSSNHECGASSGALQNTGYTPLNNLVESENSDLDYAEEESVGPLKPTKSEIRRTYQSKQTPSSRSDIEYIDS